MTDSPAPDTSISREAAHNYADHGWPVFPCQEGGKEPATEHGFLDATTDHGQIDQWWSRAPERNVAVATGAPGPDVVDVDNHGERGNGFAAWNKAQHEGLVREPLAVVQTPSGGLHAYFKGTGQRSAKIPSQHLDFRAQGGYVVAPPSRSGGRPYVVVKHQPSDATVDFGAVRKLVEPQRQPAPVRLAARDGQPRDVGHLAGWVAGLAEGNRNDGLFWASCRAIEAGDRTTLDAIAKGAQDAGLTEREIGRTIRSALRSTGRSPERQREAG
jgi:Bifunctional DNA primase/polymerase, N-terminal